jgi:hypothetical protein
MHAPMAEMVAPVKAERLTGHTQTWNLTSLPGNMHHFLPLNLLFYPMMEVPGFLQNYCNIAPLAMGSHHTETGSPLSYKLYKSWNVVTYLK